MAKVDPRLLFTQWVDAHAPELFRFAYRLTGNHQVTEDLVQETFTEAWKSIGSQREPAKARAWLFQILRYRHSHRLRDERRRIQALPLAEGMDIPQQARPTSESLADQETVRLALQDLSPDVRETFLLVFMQGLKCREAAEELHVPLGTVLSRINRARTALRSRLRVDGSLERAPSPPGIGGREKP